MLTYKLPGEGFPDFERAAPQEARDCHAAVLTEVPEQLSVF
jgi:hypothetical protein